MDTDCNEKYDLETVHISNLTELYAVWGIAVVFNATGGAVSPESKAVTQNSTYGELPTPTKPGYTFKGWYNSEGKEVNSTTVVTTASDHTLTAKWIANSYTVTFNPTGGVVSPASKTVTFGEPYEDLPNATKAGNKFLWWYLMASDDSEEKQ